MPKLLEVSLKEAAASGTSVGALTVVWGSAGRHVLSWRSLVEQARRAVTEEGERPTARLPFSHASGGAGREGSNADVRGPAIRPAVDAIGHRPS
jgi:hypothetical protein